MKELDAAAQQIGNMFDRVNGGLRGAPKFPQPADPRNALARGHAHGDTRFFETVEHSLERMSEGGIYDHLGGGFSRYSVDERWLVPHFEKMLYDNAQLLELLALAYQRYGKTLFPQRARETVAWLRREMTTGMGRFRLARCRLGGRGGQVLCLVEKRDRRIARARGRRVFRASLRRDRRWQFRGAQYSQPAESRSAQRSRRGAAFELRAILLDARGSRVRPGLDDKVLADWNGLMIAALVNAGIIFDEPSWIAMARRAFDFIAETMTQGDRLGHSCRAGKVLFPGLASDFAAMIRAALALNEATGERALLAQASLATRARCALRRRQHRRLFLERRRRRRSAVAAACDPRRRHA